METAPLKSFATWARTALIREVNARIVAVLAPASKDRVESASAVAALERDIAAEGGGDTGSDAVADKVAYTWFNRIIALRFMDANGYTGVGVVSPPRGQTTGQPEVLADAKRGNIDPAVVMNKRAIEAITALLDGTRRSDDAQGEAYALLLAEYCRHWNRSMPFMFEREGDYTELLIPANLLADESVLARTVTVLTEDVCRDVEVIGWLYQFYISERKDEVFAGFKKNKKAGAAEIPAATQLFTPHWIVRYLVENSLGRLWLLNRPTSRLAEQMEYYIKPVDAETDFLKVASPEELKIVDPACGSGHMLTYAFDLLHAIYEEEGYAPAEIPGLILTNNLYGVEIDPRAGALAAFALTMKARAKQRTFFNKQIEPNVCVLDSIRFTPEEIDFLLTPAGDRDAESAFWDQFEYADTFGSLIQPDPDLTVRLKQHIAQLDDSGDILLAYVLDRAGRVLLQADYLSARYSVAIVNPPYMGSGNMSAAVTSWIKDAYPDEKQDLYACFVVRSDLLVLSRGYIAMVTGDTWMTIKSFEALRHRLLEGHAFLSLVHMHDVSNHPDIFGANTAFIVGKDEKSDTTGVYIFLDASSSEAKTAQLLDAVGGLAPERVHLAQSAVFEGVPGVPIVYSAPSSIIAAFARTTQGAHQDSLGATARVSQGITTGQNARFLRFWWEVSFGGIDHDRTAMDSHQRARWVPCDKGGEYRKWYGNNWYVIDWNNNGGDIVSHPGSTPRNLTASFQTGTACSKISSGDPAFRYRSGGFAFTDAAVSLTGAGEAGSAVEGFCNSSTALRMLGLLAPTLNFEVGQVRALPFLVPSDRFREIDEVVRALRETSRLDWNDSETSWDHLGCSLIDGSGAALSDRINAKLDDWKVLTGQQQQLEERNNEIVVGIYDVGAAVSTRVPLEKVSLGRNPAFAYGKGKSAPEYRALASREIAADLVSYAVGCMFGRYSLDAPGLILADEGTTLQDYLAKVPGPTFAPDKDNVIPIVDGDWFEDDIVARFRQFLRVAFGEEHFEENLRFVSESLGVKDLRDYFVKSFYKDHVQRYKKRPIYWLFASPKGSFSALIYLHRYTPSTVSTVLNEYLREFKAKLGASRQHHERLALGTGTPREKAVAEKEVDRLRKVLLELDEYEHDVLYPLATQQLAIDLDDGVKANYPKFGAALKKIPGLEATDE